MTDISALFFSRFVLAAIMNARTTGNPYMDQKERSIRRSRTRFLLRFSMNRIGPRSSVEAFQVLFVPDSWASAETIAIVVTRGRSSCTPQHGGDQRMTFNSTMFSDEAI